MSDDAIKIVDKRRGHRFFPPRMLKIPKLYETESIPTPYKQIYVHYFIGSLDWYILEYSPETGEAFCLRCTADQEGYGPGRKGRLGYVDLRELATRTITGTIETQLGKIKIEQPVERDLYWKEKTVHDMKKERLDNDES